MLTPPGPPTAAAALPGCRSLVDALLAGPGGGVELQSAQGGTAAKLMVMGGFPKIPANKSGNWRSLMHDDTSPGSA
jgi:hypothetical protein